MGKHPDFNDYDRDFWDGEALPRVGRGRKKKTIFDRLLPLFLVAAFLALAYAGYFLANSWLGAGLPGEKDASDPRTAAAAQEGRQAFLLLGVDQRNKNESSRADTLIVAFIDRKGPSLSLLSLPRDTYLSIPGRGKQKLAHAHAYGGPELAMRTVSDFLDVPISKYVELNFASFQQVVDILGGVDYNVEKRMYYPEEGINLQPGPQHLSGADALAYVRFRSDPMGDLGRIERQQKFLLTVADQALKVSNVFKLPSLVNSLGQAMRTNLSPTELLSLSRLLKGIEPTSVQARMLPGSPDYINNISYWIPKPDEKEKIVADFFARKSDGGK